MGNKALDDNTIVHLRRQGLSIRQIARKVDSNRVAVKERLTALLGPGEYHRLQDEIIARNKASHNKKRRAAPISQADIDMILKMRRDHEPMANIAMAAKRSKGRCIAIVAQHIPKAERLELDSVILAGRQRHKKESDYLPHEINSLAGLWLSKAWN